MSLNSDLDAWAKDMVASADLSGFSGINVVEKILSDPGIATDGSQHRVLWWPKSKRIAKMSRAMHQIDPIWQIVLIVDSRHVINPDGTIFDKYMLAKSSSLSVRRFNEFRKKAKLKLSCILVA